MKKGNLFLVLIFPIMSILSYSKVGSLSGYLWILTLIVWMYVLRDELKVEKEEGKSI